MVDHRELRAVAGRGSGGPGAASSTPLARRRARVGRPDQVRALPVRVVARRAGLGRVEGLVRVELVDEEQEALVLRRVLIAASARPQQSVRGPGKSASPRNQPRESSYGVCPRPNEGAPSHERVGARLPRVALVSALIIPGREVAVVVLAAGLEQVRVIGDELRGDALASQRCRERLFPDLDRAPGAPQEIERAAQDVVARGHARQRAREVPRRNARRAARNDRDSASRTPSRRRRRAGGG